MTTLKSKNQLGPNLLDIVITLILTIFLIWFGQWGFSFLKEAAASKAIIVLVAIVWGVGGSLLLFMIANRWVEMLPDNATRALQPYIFVGPALFFLFWYLVGPTYRTLVLSLKDKTGSFFVGLKNYEYALTNPDMLEIFRNNLMWMILGTFLCVAIGLVVAVLADRSKYENIFKAIIFMPMAISFVGAGVIWKFVYTYKGTGAGVQEIGLLNAVVMAFGGESQQWLTVPFWNNIFLIIIMVWLQTGYAMVIISSAIKGISSEILEAARVDGANEFQIFFSIIIPSIRGTLITVMTTIVIFSLKLFDVVRVMTGGNYGTNVIANEFYIKRFTESESGIASAIAIVLLVAVVPVMVYNLKQFQDRRVF